MRIREGLGNNGSKHVVLFQAHDVLLENYVDWATVIDLGAPRLSGESTRLIALTWVIKGLQVRVRDDYDASGGGPGAGHAL